MLLAIKVDIKEISSIKINNFINNGSANIIINNTTNDIMK